MVEWGARSQPTATNRRQIPKIGLEHFIGGGFLGYQLGFVNRLSRNRLFSNNRYEVAALLQKYGGKFGSIYVAARA
jgi:hypothetical protein